MRFRFQAKDCDVLGTLGIHSCNYLSVDKANALLEAHEKTLQRVYKARGYDEWADVLEHWDKFESTHTAVLWNVEEIK